MSSKHAFDCHLPLAKGVPAEQRRTLGNALLEEAKRAANEWRNDLDRLVPSSADLTALPDGSWLLKFVFRLSKPFTSKSEVEIHHYGDQHEVQNPIVRDRLTGLPMVRPTTWKGHLRFAARMVYEVRSKQEEPGFVKRLFGESLGEENGRAGRLHFFPTFFVGDISREVITPLKRDTRTPVPGRAPIGIEVVPPGAEGTLCLLYLPHPKGPDWSWIQVTEDLQYASRALKSMFLAYGFSAKKTSGWGLIEDTVREGYLWAKGHMWPEQGEKHAGPTFQEPAPEYLSLMEAAGDPLPQLKKPDGNFLSNTEFQTLAQKPASLSVYRRFRRWYDTHGPEWRRRQVGFPMPLAPIRSYPVSSVSDLESLAKDLANTLRQEGTDD